jgi:cytochrome c oxidase assembly protein subunit 15
VLRPTTASLRGLALAAVVANVIIMSTGEAVRLSKSGLGCPDWPDCTARSLVAANTAGQTTLNTWIEFGNRLLNFPLVAVAGAVVLYVRAGEGDGPAVVVVRRDLRILGATLVGAVAVMFAAGTVVTGTGPLAGNASAKRFDLPFAGVTQLHADIGWVIGALGFALLIGLPLSGAPRKAVHQIYWLAGLTLAQGAIGYAQYFCGLPAGLVWVHVTVAVVIWVVTVRLYLAMRERGPAPGVPPVTARAAPAGAASGPGRPSAG